MNNLNVLALGSSVAFGSASKGVSFLDLLAEKYQWSLLKETVSGTTLTDCDSNSYLSRLKNVSLDNNFDLFICQLSTNDATRNYQLGEINSNDKNNIIGAINLIIKYVKDNFKCKIIFFTNHYYQNELYQKMVSSLLKIKDIYVIDLYNDKMFNEIGMNNKNLYLSDDIHPTLDGYKNWWLPKVEKELKGVLYESSSNQ